MTDDELRLAGDNAALRRQVSELTHELAFRHDEACATERYRLRERVRDWESAHQSQKERARLAEAKLAAVVGQVWPHMCRDGHEPLGFAGDDELCPACKVMGMR